MLYLLLNNWGVCFYLQNHSSKVCILQWYSNISGTELTRLLTWRPVQVPVIFMNYPLGSLNIQLLYLRRYISIVSLYQWLFSQVYNMSLFFILYGQSCMTLFVLFVKILSVNSIINIVVQFIIKTYLTKRVLWQWICIWGL